VVGKAHGGIGEERGGQERAGDGDKWATMLAPMEASGEEGRRAGEGWLRCGMLRGWRCLLYWLGEGLRRWDDQSDCSGGEWRLRPLKLGLKGDNDYGVMEEGGGLALGEGGNHGGLGAAA
jgi:hypothetical protein